MNTISQTIFDYWCRIKTKNSSSGWISRNAPCCEHRGENPDKRGRGGLKIDPMDESIVIHCFNCSFACSYTPGKPIYPKCIKLMKWLGIDDRTINQLKLESLKIQHTINPEEKCITRRNIKPMDNIPNCFLLENVQNKYSKHVDFLKTRGFDINSYPFLVSSDILYKSRIFIPFILDNILVGYSARSINSFEKKRYLMRLTTDFVFGLEFDKPEYNWMIVTEGIFDALSVKGLAVLHNEISDIQTEMICDLHKRIIVVPDLDKSGLSNSYNSLVNTAIDCNWDVSFPDWNVKDINAAYVKYGPLLVIEEILSKATNNEAFIRTKQKILRDEMKRY